MRSTLFAATAFLAALPIAAGAQNLTPGQAEFRALYEELVEINTTQSVGDCTEASEALAQRMRAGGFPDEHIHIIVPPGHPKRGNLVAHLPGSNPDAPAILLLAHIDVVEANAEDWDRDPFTLIEEDGFFYARGASDDKAMAAIFADSMIRYVREGYRPERTLKMALTCGEETPDDYNGVRHLLEHHRDLIEAGFAINENGSGRLDADGNHVAINMQAGQKVRQLFEIDATGPGGLSSAAPKDTPIIALGAALARINAYDFPLNISPSSRAYLEGMAPVENEQLGRDMLAMLEDAPSEEVQQRIIATDPRLNAMLRSGCVAVRIAGGESDTAVPMRATATLDCRMVPGESVDALEAKLRELIADEDITLARIGDPALPSPPPPMTEEILGPARELAEEMWPGVKLVPYQVNGEDDGRFLTPAGIPTYGLSGIFHPPGPTGTHGLNERVPVQSLYDARDFLHEVVKRYAGGE